MIIICVCCYLANSEKLLLSEAEALRDLHFKAPDAVAVGSDVTLTCDYDLEGVALYSVRWYRYEEEFYRFVLKESPPTKVFPVRHVQVDVSTIKAHYLSGRQ